MLYKQPASGGGLTAFVCTRRVVVHFRPRSSHVNARESVPRRASREARGPTAALLRVLRRVPPHQSDFHMDLASVWIGAVQARHKALSHAGTVTDRAVATQTIH